MGIAKLPDRQALRDLINEIANPPKGSEELAEFLITQDIFIAPSRQEPASNSLIEAIAVGLPVAFREEGGQIRRFF